LLGLRPTHGRISLDGCFDLAPSFDTCGYFAIKGETFVRVGEVLLGDNHAPLPETPRLLLAADAFAMLGTDVRGALAPCVKRIEEMLGAATLVEAAGNGFEQLYWAFRYIQSREAWTAHGSMIERYRPPLGPGIAERFAFAKEVTDAQVAEAEATRSRFRERFTRLLGPDGIMLLPTMPDVAPLLTETEDNLNDYRNQALNLLCLAGLAGCPQVSIPIAERMGAPLGLSLIGPADADLGLVRIAARLTDLRS
jgi:amidase